MSAPAPKWLRWAVPLAIALATVVTFWPVLDNGFVWDDRPLFVENPGVHGIGWTQLKYMFTRLDTGHYHPVSWLLLGCIYEVAGLEPGLYHVVGLILHIVNAWLVYLIARRLIRTASRTENADASTALILSAGLAAMAFALHPLRAEPVAWMAAIRDLLCATFYLATVLCYLRSVSEGRRRVWLAAAVVMCTLALLSKPMAVSLPIVLLVLDVYPLGRLAGRPREWLARPYRSVLVEKVPFIVLAGIACTIAPLAEMRAGAMATLDQFGPAQRAAQAVYGLAFYGVKTLVPTGLSPLYPLGEDLNPAEGRFVLSGIVVIVVSLILLVKRRRWPAALAAWVCYAVILLPVLGLIHIGPFIAADRYTVLPLIGWVVLLGGIIHGQARGKRDARPIRRRFIAIVGVTLVVLAVWSVLSFRQAGVWRNELTLWDHARRVHPDSIIAQCNYAAALAEAGQLEEAYARFREALNQRRDHAPAVHGLAYVRAKQGKHREAIRLYRLLVKAMPRSAELQADLAEALEATGQTDQAVRHYRRAIEVWPSHGRSLEALKRLTTQPASAPARK